MTDASLTSVEVDERATFYKKPINKFNYKLDVDFEESPQEVRRQSLLQRQKESRNDAFNEARGILEQVAETKGNGDFLMEVDKKTNRRAKRYKMYANQLMMSEWMIQVPEDYPEKWIAVPCPQGKRNLIVAYKGKTQSFSKKGFKLFEFDSNLPGGSRNEHNTKCTILDCIWVGSKKTYFVLDVLGWANQPLMDCDTEFRLFWLNSKLEEINQSLTNSSKEMKCKIVALPSVPCNCGSLSDFLSTLSPELLPLDGLLFYHKEVHYTPGFTPLVNWLKPFMLSEVLGEHIPPMFDDKPPDYIDFKTHICNSTKNKSIGKDTEETEMELTET